MQTLNKIKIALMFAICCIGPVGMLIITTMQV